MQLRTRGTPDSPVVHVVVARVLVRLALLRVALQLQALESSVCSAPLPVAGPRPSRSPAKPEQKPPDHGREDSISATDC